MSNVLKEAELTAWNEIRLCAGNQTAQYRPKNADDVLTVRIVPNTPKPEGFAFEDVKLYVTSRVFDIAQADLNGIVPKEGDTLTYYGTEYTVKKTNGGPAWQHLGNYNIALRVYCQLYR